MRLSWGLWRWKDVGGSITYEKKFFKRTLPVFLFSCIIKADLTSKDTEAAYMGDLFLAFLILAMIAYTFWDELFSK